MSVTPPQYQASTNTFAYVGGAAVPLSWPSHQAGDIGIIYVGTRPSSTTPTLSDAQGFAQLATYVGAQIRITLFWARATSGSMTAPTINTPSDGEIQIYVMQTFRYCNSSGNPWNAVSSGQAKDSASTSMSITGITASPFSLMLYVCVCDAPDNSSGVMFSGEVNANLTSLTERNDISYEYFSHTAVLGAWTGYLAAGGASGTLTATEAFSNFDVYLVVALSADVPPGRKLGY